MVIRVWKKLSLREKRLILLLIFGLTMAAAYHLIWQVQYTRYVYLQKTVSEEREKLAQARVVAKNLPEMEASRLQANARLTDLKSKFTGDLKRGQPIIDFGRYLDEGLMLVSVSPSELISKEHYYEAPVNIKVKGTYSQVLSFINAIDRMPQIAIKALHLSSEKGADQGSVQLFSAGPSVLAELNLIFYGLPDGQAPSFGNHGNQGRVDLFAPIAPAQVTKSVAGPGDKPREPSSGLPAQKREQFPVNDKQPEKDIYSFPVR